MSVSQASLKFQGRHQEAHFIQRLNRFAVLVELEGRQEIAHLPNSGRLRELLVPGRRVLLRERPNPGRKTRYDLSLVWLSNFWVCADAQIPSVLISQALAQGSLAPWDRFRRIQREVVFGDSRLDLALRAEGELCFIEVKSVTLVMEGRALFPDAPTLRGTRHLNALIQAKAQGYGAAVIFVIQRPDALAFSPNDAGDPDFGRALRRAARAGVAIHVYKCRVALDEIRLDGTVPVEM